MRFVFALAALALALACTPPSGDKKPDAGPAAEKPAGLPADAGTVKKAEPAKADAGKPSVKKDKPAPKGKKKK